MTWSGAGFAGSSEPEVYSHQRLTMREDRIWLASADGARPLADVGAFCLECHGGESAAASTPGRPPVAGAASHPIGSGEESHPTGMAYPVDRPAYRAVEDLDPLIRLSDGAVTCLSCHAYDAPDHRPVLAVQGGDLCQGCHIL